jgi:hypothetical protein
VAKIVQLGKFDDPNSAGLHGCVSAAQVCQFIGKVLAGHGPQCRRFSDTLRAFEDQAAIGLRPGSEDPCDARDEPARAHGTRIFCVFGT